MHLENVFTLHFRDILKYFFTHALYFNNKSNINIGDLKIYIIYKKNYNPYR